MKKLLLFFVLLSVVVFLSSPYLDQQLALIPYDALTNKFYGEVHLWCKVIYYGVNVTTFALIIIPLVIVFLYKKKYGSISDNLKRMMLISYLSLAVGPGILVNSVFKDHWGRARPYQVLRDHHPYSSPWQPHFNRPVDNSFPSGHVSIGAFIGVPFIAARRRRLGALLCLSGAILVGVVRWLQGGHYFTDIFMASLIVWMVNIIITMLIDNMIARRKAK